MATSEKTVRMISPGQHCECVGRTHERAAREPTPAEIVVYGDAPEEESETDTISIPAELLTYCDPVDPTIVGTVPIDVSHGGGGSTPQENLDGAGTLATWIAGVWALAAVLIPEVTVPATVFSVLFGLLGYTLDEDADDPPPPPNSKGVAASKILPQSDSKRAAGSKIPPRKLTLPGPLPAEPLVAGERAAAVFFDAIKCFQSAFLAADAPWTQRHFEAACSAYSELGKALIGVADTLQDRAGDLRVPEMPVDVAGRLPEMIAAARPMLGLSADDEANLIEQIRPALSRGVPTKAEIQSAVKTFRGLGHHIVTPVMVRARFAFVKSRPRS